MFKSIANKRVEISQEEFNYYEKLKEEFSEDAFIGLFESNKDGRILAITPPLNKPTSMSAVFFIFNVMINQKLRELDKHIDALKKLEKEYEDKIRG